MRLVKDDNKTKISNKQKERWLKDYKKIIKQNKDLLWEEHGLHVDWIYRMWKVYNVPIEERQNVVQYGYRFVDELIKKELGSIDKTFMKINLIELTGLTVADRIDDFNVRIVISYKYIDLVKRTNRKLYLFGGLIAISILSVLSFLFLF